LHFGSDQQCIQFYRDDFHVSYSSFLQNLPIDLQMSRAALEGNRCFFIHLGIAVGIHPFLLQTIFRYSTFNILNKTKSTFLFLLFFSFVFVSYVISPVISLSAFLRSFYVDPWFEDLLMSIVTYCDLVDANALSFLWPKASRLTDAISLSSLRLFKVIIFANISFCIANAKVL
jgi:hypothetical protein